MNLGESLGSAQISAPILFCIQRDTRTSSLLNLCCSLDEILNTSTKTIKMLNFTFHQDNYEN
jgi:hypothetical protein